MTRSPEHAAAVSTSQAAVRSGPRSMARLAGLVLLASVCAGCGGSRYAGTFDGRRGYDGNGDYGYDMAASRAEARGYRTRAARSYPVPGPAGDPWGPYIRQASARFGVPERWIREVMRQESGGRQLSADGTLTISSAGAMGLMQVMPGTYDILQRRYGLGSDPYQPQDNILAGTAYIREMYDRFGSPGFLAAYNAGPLRLDAYLAGDTMLPEETVNYLASVAPRLGTDVAMSGPLSVFAGTSAAAPSRLAAPVRDADRGYAGGGPTGQDYAEAAVDPADRAFDGGGLVTAAAPTGRLTGTGAQDGNGTRMRDGSEPRSGPVLTTALAPPVYAADPPPARMVPVSAMLPVTAPGTRQDGWGIQVGAFPDPATSRAAIGAALTRAGPQLAGSQPAIIPVHRTAMLYRARLVGISADNALAACTTLQREGLGCFTVPPGS